MGKSKSEKEAEKKAEEERLKSPTPPERQAEYYAAVDKIEADNAMVDKMQNKKGSDGKKQEWSKKDYTKADFVQFSDGIANGEGIHIDNANENVYKKYDKKTGEYVEASHTDRFKYEMQKSFVDNTAGLPTDLLLDSVYYGGVSHFFRDFTKNLIEYPLGKLGEWWDETGIVVADIAFMSYDKYGMYFPAFTPGSLLYPVFKDTKIVEYERILTYDEFPGVNREGDEPGNESSDDEAGPEFFKISKQNMGELEGELNIIGKLNVIVTFDSMAHFSDFNDVISNVGDICHAALRLRSKRKGFFGTNGKEFGLDLKLEKIGSLKLSSSDHIISREYEFKIFTIRKPDVILEFPDLDLKYSLIGNKDFAGFFLLDEKDLVTYKIVCGNAAYDKVEPSIEMGVKCQVSSSMKQNFLDDDYMPSSLSTSTKCYLDSEDLRKAIDDGMGGSANPDKRPAKVVFNKASGDIHPDAFLDGMDLIHIDYSSSEQSFSKKINNSDSLGLKVSSGQADGYQLVKFDVKYRYKGNIGKVRQVPSTPKTEKEEAEKKVKMSQNDVAEIEGSYDYLAYYDEN